MLTIRHSLNRADIDMWKAIAGYEGLYEISDIGEVRTIARRFISEPSGRTVVVTERLRKQHRNEKGYWRVRLSKDDKPKSFSTHRLVAAAFVENPNGHIEVNHKDGNKNNNAYTNLEWCTHYQNIQHAIENGLVRILRGEDSGCAKITNTEAIQIVQLSKEGKRLNEIAEMFRCSIATVGQIIKGHSWASVTNVNPLPRRTHVKIQREKIFMILELSQLGMTASDISQNTSFKTNFVQRVLRGAACSKITGIVATVRCKRHSIDVIQRAVALRKDGMKIADISKVTGISKGSLEKIFKGQQHCKLTGISEMSPVRGKGRVTPEIAMRMVQLKNEGVKYADIAEQTQCSQSNVRQILSGAAWSAVTGIVKRPRSTQRNNETIAGLSAH